MSNKVTYNYYQALNGQIFRTELDAKEYYGYRFQSALDSNILFRFTFDKDMNVIGEWS